MTPPQQIRPNSKVRTPATQRRNWMMWKRNEDGSWSKSKTKIPFTMKEFKSEEWVLDD